jgi:hypothetical protein
MKGLVVDENLLLLGDGLTTAFTVSKLLRSCGWRGIYTE